METKRINFLLSNPTDANMEDVAMIENEINKYPYAQVLHILLAKVKFHLQLEDKQDNLITAAIYASDRSILKQVIHSNNYLEEISSVVPFQDIPGRSASIQFDEESVFEPEKKDESSSIFDEVLQNLEKLKSLREQFHFLEQAESEEHAKNKKLKSEQKKAKKAEKKRKKEELKAQTKLDADEKKIKQDEILEKDEQLDSQVNAYFLNEIEHKQPSPEQVSINRHEAQKEIIERFIKAQPSIGPIRQEAEKSSDEIHKDLSEKSTRFTDDLISENLAIILSKQGKKDRAIDIYKKLIWKLPQKKAYFAARIEEIKN